MELKAEYDKQTAEKTTQEEAGAIARKLNEEFAKRAGEIQKESKADPETVVTVEISNERYDEVLMPIFKKTAQLWDVDGSGDGQKLFLMVADALEAVEEV
jgi:hypothetical protein